MGPDVRAGPGGAKNFGIRTFSIKGTPTDWAPSDFLFYGSGSWDAPRGPQGSGMGRGAENQKSKSRLFHKSKVVGDLEIRCFDFMELFPQTHPRSPRALGKSGKSPVISGLLNKKLEFGLGP